MFTHLHSHTDYSLLDGLTKVKDYVRKVKELGMTACAITDHGTAAGLVDFYDECKAQGIKPILGCEVYEAPQSRFDRKQSEEGDAYHHLVLLVKNEQGYKNLCKLVTRSNTEGFYYKPRIDLDLLEECHEGLICLSACVSGRVPKALIRGQHERVPQLIEKYHKIFGDDYYLEIQNHGLKDEKTVAALLPMYAKKFGIKVIATNDCHYVNTDDAEAHEWLLCLQTGKKLTDPTHMRYEGDYSVKSEEEMLKLFPDCPEAIYNTQEIVDKCNFDFTYGEYRMPEVVIPEEFGDDYYGYMESEAWKGYEKRYPVGHAKREEAKPRLEYELGIIKQMGFAEYFLDTRKTILWAHDHGIMTGVGRGSGAGSVMNYCLGITDIEPLKYNLLFERFLNPERISMPDIDVDYEMMHKEEVIASEAESNGKDRFAKIRTFMTMAAKGVLKDCTRVADQPVAVGVKLSKFITDPKWSLSDAWEYNPDLQDYVNSDPEIKKIWDIALRIEGTKKSASSHACGHIPTPLPCEELFPCSVDSETGYLVCEFDMVQAEHLGNLKKDLLMLRNLTIINIAHAAIKERYGIEVPLWQEEILNDKDALQLFCDGDTNGIFQFEGEGMTRFMKQLKPSSFEDIIAGVALYRPGPMDFIPKYIENKHYPKNIQYSTPLLKPILNDTYGIIIYQGATCS